ncbi:MAG: WbqC family protein [Bacteroidetes bacterium]|nr:WbqC family protein [Bacteroidota bacterium]
MQPYCFPYIGYFQLIVAADKFVMYDDVSYKKQGWINRNKILLNNSAYTFAVPLNNASSYVKINCTTIDEKSFECWKQKFLKTLIHAYNKAPFLNQTIELVQSVLSNDYFYISGLASESVKSVCEFLNIKTTLSFTSGIYNNNELKSEDRIIDICAKENADTYINAIGGMGLYKSENFKVHNLQLFFLKTKNIVYHQLKGPFVPNLSIIDVLMFNDIATAKQLLLEYQLLVSQ